MLFPEINPRIGKYFQPKDDKHLFDYTYQTYVRNKKHPTNWGVFFKTMIGKMAYS
jgi:hypothetical protein